MKMFRFLLILAFLSTAFFNSAQAQGMETETGFIALLNQTDSSVALRVQIYDAYEKILPILLSGQRRGSILEFQPEFAVGAVKIKFAAGARPSMLGGMRVFENLRDAKDMTPHPPLPEQTITKAYNPHFDIQLYTSCPNLSGFVAGDHVIGSHRDKNGKILAAFDEYADINGNVWNSCFEGNSYITPGHKITFKVYSAAGVLRGSYTVTAPNITFTTLDKTNSVAGGKGPAGKTYGATWYHLNLNASNAYLYVANTGTISSTGNWNTDFGTTTFRGGDFLGIHVDQTPRFTFSQYMSVPYSICYLDYNQCGIYGFANRAAFMAVMHDGTPYIYTGKFSYWGTFGDSIVDKVTGLPVFLAAGDIVKGTGIPAYSLPNLTANVDYETDVISGQAPPNRNFSVCILNLLNEVQYCDWVHSDGSGNYSADFTSSWDLKDTDPFIASIFYYDLITGNRTFFGQPFGP